MATILPNAKNQFIDGSGNPLAGGTVGFYIPNTLVAKDTWQDSAETTLNDNPLTLDSSGEAIIFGSGAYRQIVKDANGNLIWDQLTASVASGANIWGGTTGGTPNAQTIAASTFNGTDGQALSVIAGFTNTNATTLTIGTASPIPIVRDGHSGPVALTGGEIIAENVISLIYDAGRGAFHLVQGNESAFGQAFNYLADASAARVALSLVPGTDVQPWQAPQDQATWNAGVGITESTISPAKLAARAAATLPFTKAYDSGQRTITSAGALTLAHGLGVKPKLISTSLVCTTIDAGYAVNDEVFVNPSLVGDSSGSKGMSIVPDATNLNIRFGSATNVYQLLDKGTGTLTNIVIASWKLVVRAWA